MPTLKRSAQIGVKLESTAGTMATLSAGDYTRVITNYSQKPIGAQFEREDEAKATLSRSPSVNGAVLQEINWDEEMSGGNASIATPAPSHITLQACGFDAPTQLKKVTIGSVTSGTDGGFRCGNIFGDNATQGSATKTGRVVGLFVNAAGDDVLVYEAITGTFADTDTAYNYAATGTQTSAPIDSTPTNAGAAFRLKSETESSAPKNATVEYRNGGQIHRAVGAMGQCRLVFEHNKPPMLSGIRMRGVKDYNTDDVVPAGALVSSVPLAAQAGVVGRRAFPILLDWTYSPILPSLEIDLGNELADRPNIGSDGVELTAAEEIAGYLATRIVDRKVEATIAPEHVVYTTYDFFQKWTKASTFPLYAVTGRAADTVNGAWVVYGPTVQFTGEFDSTDRNKIVVHNARLKFCGSDDGEMVLFQVFV